MGSPGAAWASMSPQQALQPWTHAVLGCLRALPPSWVLCTCGRFRPGCLDLSLLPCEVFRSRLLFQELRALVFSASTRLATVLKTVITLIISDKRGLGLLVCSQVSSAFRLTSWRRDASGWVGGEVLARPPGACPASSATPPGTQTIDMLQAGACLARLWTKWEQGGKAQEGREFEGHNLTAWCQPSSPLAGLRLGLRMLPTLGSTVGMCRQVL